MSQKISINPRILRWSLDRSRHSAADFRKRLPRLPDALESEEGFPFTFGELEYLANATRTPLGYFFLMEPPDEGLPIPDFRTVKDEEVLLMSPDLLDTVFSMQSRQAWYREYAAGEGYRPVSFVGTADISRPVEDVASQIREFFRLEAGWARRIHTFGAAVSHVRDLLNEAGVLAVINGVVGNNPNRKLNPREFRGFVLSDDLAPLVFVNGADYKSAQMFTFFHEIAHLYLAKSGVVDIDDSAESHGRYEVYCNKVAAAALLPRDEICDAWRAQPADDTLFTQISRRFKVSPIVVGRRLMDLEVISREIFFDFYARYTAQPFADPDASDGGNFYNNQNNRIGKPFMRAIGRAAIEGKISFTHAFKLTGLSSATFDRYLREVGGVD